MRITTSKIFRIKISIQSIIAEKYVKSLIFTMLIQ